MSVGWVGVTQYTWSICAEQEERILSSMHACSAAIRTVNGVD